MVKSSVRDITCTLALECIIRVQSFLLSVTFHLHDSHALLDDRYMPVSRCPKIVINKTLMIDVLLSYTLAYAQAYLPSATHYLDTTFSWH